MDQRTLTQKWLRENVASYVAADRVFADIDAALARFPSLRPKSDVYTYDDGRTQLLLCVHGLLPISFRAQSYNIPIALWLTRDYPREPPLPYVVPTADMLVKPGPHLDVSGRSSIDYVQQWARKSEGCSLSGLVDAMQAEFSRLPPVYAKPKDSHPAQTSAQRSQQQPQQGQPPQLPIRPGQPPNLPPKPQTPQTPQQISNPDPQSQYHPAYVQPAPRIQSPGNPTPPLSHPAPQLQHHHQPPPQLPPHPRADATPTNQGPPQYRAPQYHVQAPWEQQQPPPPPRDPQWTVSPQPQSPPPPLPPHHQHQQQVPIQVPVPVQPHHAYTPAPPAPVPVPNLLDEDPSAYPAAPAGPILDTSAPAPPRPPNPELLQLHAAVHAKLSSELASLGHALALDAERLRAHQADLLGGEPALRDEMGRLEAVRDVCRTAAARMRGAVEGAERSVAELRGKSEPEVDELVCSTTIVHNQLINLVAEDNAIEDTIFHLSKALNSGRIDIERFLRVCIFIFLLFSPFSSFLPSLPPCLPAFSSPPPPLPLLVLVVLPPCFTPQKTLILS
ncbi:UEV domain-containing protein [Mycena galopus ATCC 62051]|nr:UEV domain-containing protein [Mycena galopus ATCC 62051]